MLSVQAVMLHVTLALPQHFRNTDTPPEMIHLHTSVNECCKRSERADTLSMAASCGAMQGFYPQLPHANFVLHKTQLLYTSCYCCEEGHDAALAAGIHSPHLSLRACQGKLVNMMSEPCKMIHHKGCFRSSSSYLTASPYWAVACTLSLKPSGNDTCGDWNA